MNMKETDLRTANRRPLGARTFNFTLTSAQQDFVARAARKSLATRKPGATAKQLLLERCSDVLNESYPRNGQRKRKR